MARTIEVVIGPDGSPEDPPLGFKGAIAKKRPRSWKALGRISGRNKKPEYYQREELKRQQEQVG